MKNKNSILMCAIALLQGMVFYGGVATLYRQMRGITLLEMGVIESVLSVLILVFELPWGLICDRIGYKKTLLICNFFYVISKIVFWKADSFILFLFERVLLAIVNAGLSGCDSALIYVSVEEKEAVRCFGYYHACGTVGLIFASMIFSLFIQEDITQSGLWTIYPYAFAFILTFFLKDVKSEKRSKTMFPKENMHSYLKSLKEMLPFLAASLLLTESTHTLGIFYNQLQYERVGISVNGYGFLYTFMTLCTLLNAFTGKILKYIRESQFIILIYGTAAVICSMLAITGSPLLSVFGLVLLQVCEALFYPLMDTILNRHAVISRATMLSVYSMVMNIGGIMTNLVFGKCADMHVSYAFATGSIFCMAGLILFCLWKKKENQA